MSTALISDVWYGLMSDVWHGLVYKLIYKYKSFLKELHGVLNYSNIKYIFKWCKYLCVVFFLQLRFNL